MHVQDPQPADAELVRLSLQGSRDAFGVLVVRYAKTVRGTILARLGQHRDLDDMVQETLLRAYHGLARLKDPRRFGPYVHRIAQNLAVDRLRKRGKSTVSLDEVRLEPEVADAGPAGTPEDERRHRLRSMVGKLPEALREAVLLFYFEEMSYAGMAKRLGITEAAVNQRLSRARRRLRSGMGVGTEHGS